MGAVRTLGRRILNENEVVRNFLEVLGLGMTWQHRTMRFACRSKILRDIALRRVISRNPATPLPRLPGNCVTGPSLDTILIELNEKAFATGMVISNESLEEILDFCSRTKFRPDADPDNPILISLSDEENPGSSDRFIYRLLNPHLACDAIKMIAQNPLVVEVARQYLGTEPILANSQIWWSYPHLDQDGKPIRAPEYGFHFDIDDYKFLKLFVHLIDVDEDRGPHVIIAGTHKKKDIFEKLHRRLSDEQAEARYGDRVTVMTGKRGTGFFEDTFCYHKGTSPKHRRLLLQIEYAISKRD